jgi:hypothetical protein
LNTTNRYTITILSLILVEVNGTVKAGTTLTRADTDNTLWTLVVRPAQGRNSGDLKVTVLADSVIGVKANENAAKSHSIGLHTRPTFVSQWVKSASASSNTSLAGRLTDDPESTLGNRQQLNDPNSWIEAKATSINGTNYGAKPNLTLTYRTPIYIQYIVIRETFNTREGGQDVWGIDSKGNEVRLRGTSSVSRPAKEVLLLALALLTHCDTNVGLVCNPILWLFAAFSLALTPITESARTVTFKSIRLRMVMVYLFVVFKHLVLYMLMIQLQPQH